MYAIILAFLLRGIHIAPPDFLLKPIDLVGAAAIPTLLLVLGIQLSRTRLQGNFRLIGVATAIRLLVAPMLAFLLTYLMGLQGLTRQVCIFEASTPAAVTAALMAIEFDCEPEFVTSVVLVTTLLSSVSLTVILSILG
jgi:predicted permease